MASKSRLTQRFYFQDRFPSFGRSGIRRKRFLLAEYRAGLLVIGLLIVAVSASAAEIHTAAKAGDLAAVERLIQADASLLNLKDAGGNTPLHAAAEGGAASAARFLIEKGADREAQNAGGNTPLHIAMKAWNISKLAILPPKCG